MNLEIYHDTPEDYIRNIRTCRIVVPRGRLVKAHTMKFKLPRGEFGRKVLMWKFEDLSLDTGLIYYDGPILSLFRDAKGDGYLVFWVDQDDVNTWLMTKPQQDMIEHFVFGSIDLLTILQSSNDCSIFEQDATRLCFNQREINISDYPQYMPEAGFYL